MLSKSDIMEDNTFFSSDKGYGIKKLQLSIDDYKVITQFSVVSIESFVLDKVGIILGSPWLDTLGTSMINTRKNFLSFLYKNKTIFSDVTLKLSSEVVSSEDFKWHLKDDFIRR